VPDVHAFPGHIACDSASRSEIVIPIRCEGKVAAVLDIDSPVENRFSEEDRYGLEEICRIIEDMAVWQL
jgi:GAF domain-containing protein